MKSYTILVLTLILLTLSCNNRKVNIVTFDLKRSDFVEKLNVTGTVQAVNNYPVVAPRNNYGSMTVSHLVEDGSFVKKGDTICVLSSPQLISFYESFVTALEILEADFKKLEADNALNLSLLKAQLDNTNAQLQISSLDSVQMNFAPAVRKKLLALEMEKTTVEKGKIEKKYAAQKIIDNSEIRQMKSRIMQQQGRIQMLNDQINSLIIIAQRDGIVMQAEAPTLMFFSSSGSGSIGGKIKEGSSVFPNLSILQFPDLSRMQVSAEVAESDYKRIEKGQKVMIRIEAVEDLYTTGKINRKMIAGKTRQSDSKVKTYEVIMDIDSCHLKMKPGLSSTCEIIIDEVKDTIIVPTLAIYERDSLKIVYVEDKDKFIPVTIETGKANSSHTIVSKGLFGNETIALSEPSYNLIKKIIKPTLKKDQVEKAKTDSVKTIVKETISGNSAVKGI
jgi:multidrug efflux pump subunit AcrA (membrane-fusion protein)